jgi:hypothetical protein
MTPIFFFFFFFGHIGGGSAACITVGLVSHKGLHSALLRTLLSVLFVLVCVVVSVGVVCFGGHGTRLRNL